MLLRDNRNQEALVLLQTGYDSGNRDPGTVLQLYKSLMSFADIAHATTVIERYAAERPDDAHALALLARHYGDTQNVAGEMRALERLFALSPSPDTAQQLLAIYRLDGAFDREERLLRSLLANQMIAQDDSERLGLLLFAQGDLDGARQALMLFDQLADPERMIGRLALFDLLVYSGDTQSAFAKVAAWIPNWRAARTSQLTELEASLTRLARTMTAVDAAASSRILCELPENRALTAVSEQLPDFECPLPANSIPVGELVPEPAMVRAGQARLATRKQDR
jgi:hypothetical protein